MNEARNYTRKDTYVQQFILMSELVIDVVNVKQKI